MILSDKTILKNLAQLVKSQVDEELVQACSLDFTVGDKWLTPKSSDYVYLNKGMEYEESVSLSKVIYPGEFILATTEQYFCFPANVAGFVQGRSSIGRLGLFIQNAGWVDGGFEGKITLELYNASKAPIVISQGDRLGQVVFVKIDEIPENPYSGKYQGQDDTTGSRIEQDFSAFARKVRERREELGATREEIAEKMSALPGWLDMWETDRAGICEIDKKRLAEALETTTEYLDDKYFPNEYINHPAHYNKGKYEAISVIEDWKLSYNLGNAVKYIARCEHKGNKLQDLEKAIWYLQREIKAGVKDD